MIPEPKVRKVAPVATCRICHDTLDLIEGDGPPVCRLCVRIQTRLAVFKKSDAEQDHDNREGAWPE